MIFVSNVETGETKQVTDGLADAMFPAWDASGKYLWFFASTNFGLGSQWLDMTSYDREETFGLYLAVLKKGEPSPLLPESDEDLGRAAVRLPAAAPVAVVEERRPARDSAEAAPDENAQNAAPAARTPRAPVTVQIDFDGLQQRIVSVPGVPDAAVQPAEGRAPQARFITSRLRREAAAAVPAAAPRSSATA